MGYIKGVGRTNPLTRQSGRLDRQGGSLEKKDNEG